MKLIAIEKDMKCPICGNDDWNVPLGLNGKKLIPGGGVHCLRL